MSLSPADPTVTAPIATITERPRWRETFVSLKVHNYRLYVVAQLVANTAQWMQRIATDWLVLELTGSVTLVGVTVMLQFAPFLLFGPWGGMLADRLPKRTALIVLQSAIAVLSALQAVLAITGAAQLWVVWSLVFLIGMLQVVDGPTRTVFIAELVGQSRLRNAISLNATIFHLGGFLGPALAGVLIVAVGAGWAIGVNAIAITLAIGALLAMRTSELRVVPRGKAAKGQIRAALAYVSRKPTIFWPMVVLAFVSVFGMSLPTLLAGVANAGVFGNGAGLYGLFNSLVACGAMTGALLSARRTTLRLRTVVIGAAIYGLLQLSAGLAPWLPLFGALLVGVGLARLLFALAAETLTQLSTNLAIRGRIMSLYTMVLIGGQALGGPIMGAIAEHAGPRVALVVSGGVPLVAAIVIALVLATTGQLKLRVRIDPRTAPVRIVSRTGRRVHPSGAPHVRQPKPVTTR